MGGGAGLGAWSNGYQRDHRGYGASKSIAYGARITGDYPDYTLTDGGDVDGCKYYTPPSSTEGTGTGVSTGDTKGYGIWTHLLMLTKVLIERESEENVEGSYSGSREELLPVYDYKTVDSTLQPIIEEEKCANDGKPTLLGQTYLQAQGTDETNYQRLIYPVVEMVADHNASDSIHSTIVYDTYQDGLDRRVNAGMHTFWWIKQRENKKWNIAWNQKKSDQDDTGYGFECHLGDGSGVTTKLNQSTENPSDVIDGTEADTREDQTTLAYCSWLKYGHHHPGHSTDDKHKFGENEDGQSINANHIWMKSFFYYDQQFDAPLDFEPVYNPRPGPMPNRARVHFQTDPTRNHDFELGSRSDIHYWWAECVFDPPTYTPPTIQNGVPPEEPPDTTYVPHSVDNTNIYETTRGGKYTTSTTQSNTRSIKRIKEANSPFQIGSPSFVARAETKSQDGQEYGGEWGPTNNPQYHTEPGIYKEYDYGSSTGRKNDNTGNEYITYLPDEPTKIQEYKLTPIVAHLNFIGKLNSELEWEYTQETENSNFEGGTTAGGIWITPPEFTYNIQDSGTYSDTFFGLHHSIDFGWGAVNNDNINQDGAIFSISGSSGSYNIDLDFYNTTPASRAGTFNVNGYITATKVGGAGGFWLPDDTNLGFGNTTAAPDATMYWENASSRLRLTTPQLYYNALLTTPASTTRIYNYQQKSVAAGDANYLYNLFNYQRLYGGNNYTGAHVSFYNSIRNQNTATVSSVYGVRGYVDNASTGTITNAYAILNGIINSSTGTIGNARGSDSSVSNNAGGTIINAYSQLAIVQNTAAGTINTAYNNINRIINATGTISTAYNNYNKFEQTGIGGVITDAYGDYFANAIVTAGAITNYTHIYLEAPTTAGTNYAIVTAGGDCVFNSDGHQDNFAINTDNKTIFQTDGTNDLVAFGDTGGANYMTFNDGGKLQPHGTANYLSAAGNPGINDGGSNIQQFDMAIENGLIVSFTEIEAVSDLRVINANQTMLITDQIVECTNAITYTLLPVATAGLGKVVTIKNYDPVNTMTVTGDGVEEIDDELNQTIAPYEALKVYANATKWGSI